MGVGENFEVGDDCLVEVGEGGLLNEHVSDGAAEDGVDVFGEVVAGGENEVCSAGGRREVRVAAAGAEGTEIGEVGGGGGGRGGSGGGAKRTDRQTEREERGRRRKG